MSKATVIIGEINQYVGDIHKLLTRLQGDDCSNTEEQKASAVDAQSNLAYWQKVDLYFLRKKHEG
ncbi:unnamed protein product [marine sediment metagenome]|uniref:Uncharacterized protein n=1 Tax=marine sediment metagenome TaxID=412755 RepID=X0TWS9_9ZZZZ